MTLFIPASGQRVLKPKKLTTTNATTIATPSEKKILTIESITISTAGTGGSISLYVNDGTTDYYIMNALPLGARALYTVTDAHIPLRSGWTLKALASAANQFDILAVLIQSNPTNGNNNG